MSGADARPQPPADLLTEAALFLDFDGTLVELAETPDSIQVPPELPKLLNRLSDRLGGRLALVTGRAIRDLEKHLACADIAVSGSHGAEIRSPGQAAAAVSVPALDRIHAQVAEFERTHPGLLAELKPAGAALHFRSAPEQASRVAAFMDGLAAEHGLAVQTGKMVVELRAAGVDKGVAVRGLMAIAPFAGARPIFVGDDLTDEHAFQAVADLGGAGVLVGPDRDTAAAYRLPDVPAVHRWLEGQA